MFVVVVFPTTSFTTLLMDGATEAPATLSTAPISAFSGDTPDATWIPAFNTVLPTVVAKAVAAAPAVAAPAAVAPPAKAAADAAEALVTKPELTRDCPIAAPAPGARTFTANANMSGAFLDSPRSESNCASELDNSLINPPGLAFTIPV